MVRVCTTDWSTVVCSFRRLCTLGIPTLVYRVLIVVFGFWSFLWVGGGARPQKHATRSTIRARPRAGMRCRLFSIAALVTEALLAAGQELCVELGQRVLQRNPDVHSQGPHLATFREIAQPWTEIKSTLPPAFGNPVVIPSAERVKVITEQLLRLFSPATGIQAYGYTDNVTSSVNELYSRVVSKEGVEYFFAALGEAVAHVTGSRLVGAFFVIIIFY